MAALPGMAGREAALLEELAEKGEAKGEELFYPLAFERPGSVLDYLATGSDGHTSSTTSGSRPRRRRRARNTRASTAGRSRKAPCRPPTGCSIPSRPWRPRP